MLCIFVPFYQIYWIYKHGQKIDIFAKSKNLDHSDVATLYLILVILNPIVAIILMQDKINFLCTVPARKNAAHNAPAYGQNAAQTLKQYKELLDCNAITQEEYDAIKKQLLGL